MLVKTFRLFVSSTFKDFVQERELLQSKVFPALDAYCAARGYQFHPVDLRWGVNEEAQLDQRTAEICLGEVVAAKGYPAPNFLVMIGTRYGWVPLPFAIAQDEFEAVLRWLESRGEQDAVRDLRQVYQLDENHEIPCGLASDSRAPDVASTSAYTLRSRDDEISDLKDAATWERLEARLRSALQASANHLLQAGRINGTNHQQYFLSLTEQEIIRGLPSYRRDGALKAADNLKQLDTDGPYAIAWIRERSHPPALLRSGRLRRWLGMSTSPAAPAAPAPDPQVSGIACAIKQALPEDCVATVKAMAGADGKFDQTYLGTFVSTIQSKLEAAIDRHITAIEAVERAPDFELQGERAEHRAFADERRKVFIGRDGSRAAFTHYIRGTSSHPLVLHGASGSGKSALMARAVAEAEATQQGLVISRFIGASAASSDLRSMLISLVDELHAHSVVQKPRQWEDDDNKFVEQVRGLLSAINKPTVIFIDALDQLRKPWRPGWLSPALPKGVKIVVSALDDKAFPLDSGIFRSLQERLPADAFLKIEPLTLPQGYDIIRALENLHCRRLQQSQREYIIGQFDKAGSSPLYLRIAFEIARGWRSHDVTGQGRCVLADDTTELVTQFISDLSDVHHHEPEVVTRTLGYLAAAKDGLSAKELTEVLSRDRDVMDAISSEKHSPHTARLPASVWARLQRHLASLLVEKRIVDQPLLQVFHRQVGEVARRLPLKVKKTSWHDALSNYFEMQFISKQDKPFFSPRCLSELPFHLHNADNTEKLSLVLESPHWIMQKLEAFNIQALLLDYQQFARSDFHKAIGQALRLSAGAITRDNRQLFVQLVGRLIGGQDQGAMTFLTEIDSLVAPPAIIPLGSGLTISGSERDRFYVTRGRVTVLAPLPDGKLAAGYDDGTLRVWDTEEGLETARSETWQWMKYEEAQFLGDLPRVLAIAVYPDSRLAMIRDEVGVELFDPYSGISTRVPDPVRSRDELSLNDPEFVFSCLSDRDSLRIYTKTKVDLPGGRLALGERNTIRILDAKLNGKPRPKDRSIRDVTAFEVLPTGRLALGFRDGKIRICTPDTHDTMTELVGHTAEILALKTLRDGRLASVGDCVRLWDLSTGRETVCHKNIRLSGRVTALADGRFGQADGRFVTVVDAISGAVDRQNDRWGRGEPVPGEWDMAETLDGERDYLAQAGVIALLPDGRLVWTLEDGHWSRGHGRDYCIRLWDLNSAKEFSWGGPRNRHDGPIRALAVLSGSRIASGSTDKSIRVWDLETGAETIRLKGHTDSVGCLAVLPSGWLASGSDDNTIRLWDLASGNEVTRLELDACVRCLVSPSANRLGALDAEGTYHWLEVRT